MKPNFDEIIDRHNTNSLKHDSCAQIFGREDVLPLWVADMDFPCPDVVIQAIKKRLEHPVFGYFNHSDAFYQSIMGWMRRRHAWEIEKDWICFSPGVVSGLAMAVQAFSRPGDKIIVQPPVYHPFYYVVERQNRVLLYNNLILKEDQYSIDFADLEEKLKLGAKILLLCNPHNPVGRSWTKEDLQKLGELCLKYSCLVVSDEIHSDLIMAGHVHTPMASLGSSIAGNTITFMAPSKTFNLAGMASSEAIISNAVLRKAFCGISQEALHVNLGNTFGDVALEAAYTQGEAWLNALLDYLNGNLNYLTDFVSHQLPSLRLYRHEATYLVWVDFSALGLEHKALQHKLVYEAGLGFSEGSIFGPGGEQHMRINIACPRSVL
ncbi:MAG: PatB family C-S lyase, partial [Bacteroidales bacterium]|nr:PatB family C-S lyase [Bacteroidales bacterium]